MRWGATILTIVLLIALVWASGCADVSFGQNKIGDFGSTKEEQKAVEFFKTKYGDPLTNSGPPRFLEPMVTTGLMNNTPINKVTKFSKDTSSIFFWVFYDNFKKGDTLTLTWTFSGRTVISLKREAGGDFGRAFGEFIKPDKGWATGTHTITITGGGTSAAATFEIIDGQTQTVPLPYEQVISVSPSITTAATPVPATCNGKIVDLHSASDNCGQCGQECNTGCHCADGYCISDSFKPTERSQTGDFSYPECYKPKNPQVQPPQTSGNFPTYTEIYQGAAVYIGEEGLNLTYALDDANDLPAGSSLFSTPKLVKIGWWAPATLSTSVPTKVIDIGQRYKSMTISPSDFVSYTGNWYILDESGTKPAATKPLIVVVDPVLDMSILKYGTDLNPESNGIKLNNGAVKRGDLIGFSYSTNMNQASWFTRRSIAKNRGFIDIRVRDPSKAIFQNLRILDKGDEKSGKTWGVPLIWELPYDQLSNWGGVPPNKWDTGVKDANGNYIYASGTYIVQARSSLNNMVDNYKNVGADYTGKTVSPEYTITINP